MSFLGQAFFWFALHGVMVSSTVQFFLYPLPIPGRTLTGVPTTTGLSPVSTVSNNGIMSPFSNFHFQVRDTHGGYHFGYDTEKSYREEKRDAFSGVVTGRYGYLDPNGIHRIVEYIADHNGYRARSTNQFFVEAAPVVSPAQTVAQPPQPSTSTTIQVIGPIPKPISQYF